MFAFGEADVQARAFGEQVLSAQLFQLIPLFESPLRKWNVCRPFSVCGANNSRVAVRAASIVHERKLFQTEHTPTAASQLKAGSRAHSTQTQHDDIE